MKKKIKKKIIKIRKWIFKNIINTKGGYLVVGIIIGWTVFYIITEGGKYYTWLQEGLSYTNREYLNKDVGISVREVILEAEVLDTPLVGGEGFEPAVPAKGSVEDKIRSIAKRENFQDADLLIRIASCESGLIPNRRSDIVGSSAMGLFQILDMHKLTVDERCDVDIATTWTINHIKAGKLSAWNASKQCWNI